MLLIIAVLYSQTLILSSVIFLINTLMLITEFFFETKSPRSRTNEFKDCVVPVPRPLKSKTPVAEDQWTDEDNTYHTGNGQWHENGGEWSGGSNSTYHTGQGMWEDFATSNYITNENEHVDFGDIITARELIGLALQDSTKHKHKYFEFLKHLRNSIGKEYSTQVHQHAAKLAKAAKDL